MQGVECRICGKEQGSITYLHLKSHGVTLGDYRSMFPDAPLVSRATCARLSEAGARAWANLASGFHQGRGIKIWATRRARGTSSGTLKGRTYEEIHGAEKAKELKAVRKASRYWEHVSAEQRREQFREVWRDPEKRERTLRAQARRPNTFEAEFGKLLDQYFPNEWKFVGDGQVIIGGKRPDFININGKKLVIEIYYPYWKVKDYGSEEAYIEERRAHFLSYGFGTIFVPVSEFPRANMRWAEVMEKVAQAMNEGGEALASPSGS